MHTPILPSLEITNFRIFRHLRIEHLGQVNLVVGKNNVGKTALLEALWLYARRGVPAVIRDQVARRDEAVASDYGSITALRHIFTNRPDQWQQRLSLTIGPIDTPEQRLDITIEPPTDSSSSALPRYVIRHGGTPRLNVDLLASIFDIDGLPTLRNIEATILTADGRMNPAYPESLWEKIALTDDEERVIAWLQLIAPEIERISLKSDGNGRGYRVPMARIRGGHEPVALRSFGDGLVRLFALAVTAFSARNGLLLIDEIENGLHYSIQPALWRRIFELAATLNIQVFATTHSWDCIEAFQIAAAEHQADGRMIKLGRSGGEIVATSFSEHDMAIITHEQIEVR